jgi:hypothetical protein
MTTDHPKLRNLTTEFGCPTTNGFFHNAGNDANYTLQLLPMLAISAHPASANDPRALRLRALAQSAVPTPVASHTQMLKRAVRAESINSFEHDRKSLAGPSNEGKRSRARGKRAGKSITNLIQNAVRQCESSMSILNLSGGKIQFRVIPEWVLGKDISPCLGPKR